MKQLPATGKLALLNICNEIWSSGNIPASWKESITIPIHKNNRNVLSPDSYRPISLPSCPGKIMERLVNRRLINILEERNLLNSNQFAFRQGKGTESHLAELEIIFSQYLNKGWHVDCTTLDIEKAYDRMWRYPVLKAISQWGILGNMGRFLNNFLQDCTFRVLIGGKYSNKRKQENGVPQGSVLSVTLLLEWKRFFNIFRKVSSF